MKKKLNELIQVMYVIAPLLIAPSKVPKSILFYILSLCIADLLIMFGE